MNTWPEIRQWRKEQRDMLLKARVDAGMSRRLEWNEKIEAHLRAMLPQLNVKTIGFYWPFKGEFDARPLVRELIAAGVAAALPVVVQPKSPLEFRRWTSAATMEAGAYGILICSERDVVTPDLLLVPMVGFDASGYRLGYGGGFYDRTFAAISPKPYSIGIAYELSRLETIYPQAHDIPLDAVITESSVTMLRRKQS
jgi:5-formyltetrahydrofolate cyclo-ligase